MIVTIEGSAKQIEQALNVSPLNKLQLARLRGKARRDLILANRKIIRRAFDLIRYDPNEHLLVDNLAGALGGRLEVTRSLLATAHQIIAERS